MNTILTIIIPTYNRARIIGKTIESVLNQTFLDWECLIVDDHSIDDTAAVISEFSKRDNRIQYILNIRKKGAQGARNTGLYKANADWVFFFDSDNIMKPLLLEKLVSQINNKTDVVSCFSNIVDIEKGPTGRLLKSNNSGNIHEKLFTGQCYVDFNQAILRRNKLIEIGGLDEDCPSMQEWDTHIRLSENAIYATVPEPLVDYYVGGKDAISTDTKREVVGRLYILKKHNREWHRYKDGCTLFVQQIRQLIAMNKDKSFRLTAKAQLLFYAPASCIEILKGSLRPLYYKLTRKA